MLRSNLMRNMRTEPEPVALRDGTTELSTEESSGEEEYMCIHCGTKYDTEKEEDESNVRILVAKL